MKEYEYVTRKEYSPVQQVIEKQILCKVHSIMRKEYGITFQHKLIGSGSRHLITRLKNGNCGFDFDYNLVLENVEYDYSAKEFKENFIIAFNKAIKGTKYKCAENSTSAITLKVIDLKNCKIVHSVDFAIISYIDYDEPDQGYEYIRNLKDGRYQWAFRHLSKDAHKKLNEITKYDNGWNAIRDEYMDIKCKQDKHSFALYFEAINNIYNQIQQDKRSQNSYGCFY